MEDYLNDKRMPCKYGVKCYQKNKIHHEKYKHPPKNKGANKEPPRKKFKMDEKIEANTSSSSSDSDKDDKVNNDVSESETSQSDNESNVDLNKPDPKEETKLVVKEVEPEEVTPTDNKLSELEAKCNDFIKEKFLVSMPMDFYLFWRFCSKLNSKNPFEALKEVGLYLVGPFDVLAGKFDNVVKSEEEYLLHWRYYRDPPEMQTILASKDQTGYHIGYFRDSPCEPPALLVSNSSNKNGILTAMGGNIFSALNIYLEELKKAGDPFKKMHVGKIQAALLKESDLLKIDMSKKTKLMVAREKKIVARTFNKIGLVVPFNKKTEVGYRPLALDNKQIETYLNMLEKSKSSEEKENILSKLQPVFTYASIATDECDFGTGIELGWNIISHGVNCLNSTVERFLTSNYKLLNREEFAKITQAHMKNRKKNCNLSIV